MTKDGRKLLSVEREHLIEELLDSGYTGIINLSNRLGVSEATIRRDLLSLEEAGKIRRVHGGAVKIRHSKTEPLFKEKVSLNYKQKESISRLALSLIEDHDTIYLDGGSTIQILAKQLSSRKNLTIITNSLIAAVELMETEHRLIIVGGEFRRLSRTIVGALTRKILDSINIRKAFLGTIGFTIEKGMTTTDPNEAYTKELVMKNAEKVFVLADNSKIGHNSFAVSGDLNYINSLITDKKIKDKEFIQKLKDMNVQILTPDN